MLVQRRHWADQGGADTPRRQRLARLGILRQILAAYACRISDWQGSAYVLESYTGKSEIVHDLAQIWAAVERLTGRKPDPLALVRSAGRIQLRPEPSAPADAAR
ncbi:hypothetical protein [Pigmentiphaga soli]|uniref:hypothetical protein n=1 Tax=Pigmentiphaga soli TaxID=1007095 RepID=UPI0031E7650A